jgi:phage terminase Nu1 subunit (DNA packaging protein)
MFLISERQIQRLTNQGILRLATDNKRQVIRGRYVLGEVVGSYAKHLRDSVAQDPEEKRYKAARARRMNALARKEELELEAREGDLHFAEDIEFCLTSMFTFMKQRVLAIPVRVSRMVLGVTDFRKVYETINNEVRGCLTDLSTAKYAEIMAAQRTAMGRAQPAGEVNNPACLRSDEGK